MNHSPLEGTVYLTLLGIRLYSHTGGAIKRNCNLLGLTYPHAVTDMYLTGESAAYIEQAIMTVNQIGE